MNDITMNELKMIAWAPVSVQAEILGLDQYSVMVQYQVNKRK
jgi:hypothetical protein